MISMFRLLITKDFKKTPTSCNCKRKAPPQEELNGVSLKIQSTQIHSLQPDLHLKIGTQERDHHLVSISLSSKLNRISMPILQFLLPNNKKSRTNKSSKSNKLSPRRSKRKLIKRSQLNILRSLRKLFRELNIQRLNQSSKLNHLLKRPKPQCLKRNNNVLIK